MVAVGGGAAVAAALVLFVIGLSLAQFIRGSLAAYRASKSKWALGLLVGHIALAVGLFLFWSGGRQSYDAHGRSLDEHGKKIILSPEQQELSYWLILAGLLLASFCFVGYVKQHNKSLNSTLSVRT